MPLEPLNDTVSRPGRPRSTSRSRPTTPLRPSSRSSFRESARASVSGEPTFPLNAFEPAFGEFADAMADLEANMMHFQLMHESLARFSESFASFLYGLNMNAFCVDFPEGPIAESFRRAKQTEEVSKIPESTPREADGETTFMTTDVSFIDNPSTATKSSTKFETPARAPTARPSRMLGPGNTRGRASSRGRQTTRGTARPSGLARPKGRGVR